ncbi:LysR family transcriptional regulator, partial [Psychrobacter sp. 1501(2011)]
FETLSIFVVYRDKNFNWLKKLKYFKYPLTAIQEMPDDILSLSFKADLVGFAACVKLVSKDKSVFDFNLRVVPGF